MCYGIVYCIENQINGKKYIGVTTRTVHQRFAEHCVANSVIGRAIRKYGSDNFSIHVVDRADNQAELFRLEKEWIKNQGTYSNGYNSTIGGEGAIYDYSIEPVYTEEQELFIEKTLKLNKEEIDVNNQVQMIKLISCNVVYLYLTSENKIDKRECARLLLKMNGLLTVQFTAKNIINIDEVRRWSNWRSTPTG